MPRTAPVVTGAAHLGHEANGGRPQEQDQALPRAPAVQLHHGKPVKQNVGIAPTVIEGWQRREIRQRGQGAE